jgi:hypothetical protein
MVHQARLSPQNRFAGAARGAGEAVRAIAADVVTLVVGRRHSKDSSTIFQPILCLSHAAGEGWPLLMLHVQGVAGAALGVRPGLKAFGQMPH